MPDDPISDHIIQNLMQGHWLLQATDGQHIIHSAAGTSL